MIDFEKLREQKSVIVLNQRIAEKLVFRYGLSNLIAIERSRKDSRKKAYIFYNFPELVDEFKSMVEELQELKAERWRIEQEYYYSQDETVMPESDLVIETISSVNDSDVVPEDNGQPKKRGRKKKEIDNDAK